jgi:hypothetical protein
MQVRVVTPVQAPLADSCLALLPCSAVQATAAGVLIFCTQYQFSTDDIRYICYDRLTKPKLRATPANTISG